MNAKLTNHQKRLYGNYVELAFCVFTLFVLLHTASVNAELDNQVAVLNNEVSYVPVCEVVYDDAVETMNITEIAAPVAFVSSPVSSDVIGDNFGLNNNSNSN